MQLEDSQGTKTSPKNLDDVRAAVGRVGNGTDHCILSDGDLFIQTAASSDGLIVQYGEGGELYEAQDSSLPVPTVQSLFVKFYQGDSSWKRDVAFSSGEGPGGESSASGFKSPVDSILGAIKSEAGRSATSWLNRAARKIVRKILP